MGFSSLVFQSLLAGLSWGFAWLWWKLPLFAVWEGRAWHGVGDGSTGDSTGDTDSGCNPNEFSLLPGCRCPSPYSLTLIPSWQCHPDHGKLIPDDLNYLEVAAQGNVCPSRIGLFAFHCRGPGHLLFTVNCEFSRNGGICLKSSSKVPPCPLEMGQQSSFRGSECCRVRMLRGEEGNKS